MHPGFMSWWHHARRGGHGCGTEARWGGYDEGLHAGGPGEGEWGGGWGPGAFFGVRRPLRFLAYKLNLSDAQVNELARILNDLKTERAQSFVDNRRATSALADAIAGEAFDESKAKSAADDRVKSAEKIRDAVVAALRAIHAVLQPGQREQLAYLIRTGALMI